MAGHELTEALRVQGRVLLALMLREARTRYGRMKGGYLWALVEPAIHITVFSLLFSSRMRIVPLGDSMVAFLATGFAVFLGFRNVMSRTQGGYGSNEALLSFPVVRVMDVFLARALLELATWLTVTILLFGGLVLLGMAPIPHSILAMLEAIFALFGIGFGFGLAIGIISQFWVSVRNLISVPLRLLYWCSAVFYLPDNLPPAFRAALDWNPVVHGITLFREGYYDGYQSHMLDVEYLFVWSVGSVLCGLVLEKAARKPLRNLAA